MTRLAIVPILLVACGERDPHLVHGGGELTIELTPIGDAGLDVQVTTRGATEHQLFNERATCISYATEEHFDEPRPTERSLAACVDQAVPAAGGCFDAVHLDLWVTEGERRGPGQAGPYAFFFEGDEYEDEEDEIVVEFVQFEWIGSKEGTFTADVLLTHACLGPDPVPHRLEVGWSFTETYEEIEGGGGPRDPAPPIYEL